MFRVHQLLSTAFDMFKAEFIKDHRRQETYDVVCSEVGDSDIGTPLLLKFVLRSQAVLRTPHWG